MPRVPNIKSAYIPSRKITEYLLRRSSGETKGKGGLFLRFGFSLSAWQMLHDALMQHLADHDVERETQSPAGRRFRVNGRLRTPDGRHPWIVVVWMIDSGDTDPRLITAYPGKAPKP